MPLTKTKKKQDLALGFQEQPEVKHSLGSAYYSGTSCPLRAFFRAACYSAETQAFYNSHIRSFIFSWLVFSWNPPIRPHIKGSPTRALIMCKFGDGSIPAVGNWSMVICMWFFLSRYLCFSSAYPLIRLSPRAPRLTHRNPPQKTWKVVPRSVPASGKNQAWSLSYFLPLLMFCNLQICS